MQAEGDGPPQGNPQHCRRGGNGGRNGQRNDPGLRAAPVEPQQSDQENGERERGGADAPPLSRHRGQPGRDDRLGTGAPAAALARIRRRQNHGMASAGRPGGGRLLPIPPVTTGSKKRAAASSSSATDTGRVAKIPRLPCDMMRLRRSAASVSSPRTMATTIGASG